MTIYTKIGDKGKTTFFGCGLVSKDDVRIETFGALDELNSIIGLAICFIDDQKLITILKKIQNDLFQVGSDIAGSSLIKDKLPSIHEQHIKELENEIDNLQNQLSEQKSFIIPGGTLSASILHLCRAVTRRCERSLVKLKKQVPHLNTEMLKYINRLSDLLFCLARYANKDFETEEQKPIYKYFENSR